jgi:(p)ppGpp synthase/HD superfamily hydrolase
MIRNLNGKTTTYYMTTESLTKDELLSYMENEAKIRIDSLIEGSVETAEEVHAGIKREDGASSFLETHIWPVTLDVIKHYQSTHKLLTTLQISSAILHDVMEDNDRILDLYAAKAYGFDAYFKHRFGDYVSNIAMTLKTKPLENFPGSSEEEQKHERFMEYCHDLVKSEYDVKIIKLADRLNNMKFISKIPEHEKVKRYLREAEDFYLAYPIIPPQTDSFYKEIRNVYDELKSVRVTAT